MRSKDSKQAPQTKSASPPSSHRAHSRVGATSGMSSTPDLDAVLDDDKWRMSSIQNFLVCEGDIDSPFVEMNSKVTNDAKAAASALVQRYSAPVPVHEDGYKPRRTYRRLQGKLSEEQKVEHRRQQNRQAQERYRKRKTTDDTDLSS
mmetsp:Transcript_49775/g.130917  ORF Transcript_49775/g.130917 Transcript_49775/m.130917 type:complete len:147 (+) Transcript_49775:62-502(+)